MNQLPDGTLIELPRRQILSDDVYEVIKALVMDHRLDPGERLNIYELARSLRVSPTPVREALARLDSDGLVTKEPLRGYSVAPLLDLSSFLQLYEIRLMLEPAAARKAAEAATEEHIGALEQQVTAMRESRAGERYEEYRQFAAKDAEFHETIALAHGNRFLRDILVRLRAHLHLYRLYFHGGIGAETVPEHERILEALRRRNADEAEAAMRQHIEQSRERLSGVVKAAH